MKYAFVFLISVFSLSSCVKTLHLQNLDFEDSKNGRPAVWSTNNSGDYSFTSDMAEVFEGKYSGKIKLTGTQSGTAVYSYALPAQFDGKTVKLSGNIKTDSITNGWGALWMRIDPDIAFDNMMTSGREIRGTTDWTQYEITLHLEPGKTEEIVFGTLLLGNGTL